MYADGSRYKYKSVFRREQSSNIIEQGFLGNITLEITVQKPTIIYPNILFGQIMWLSVVGKAQYYEGDYQNQNQPTISNIHKEMRGLKR